MKKLIFASILIFGATFCEANSGDATWLSSNTVTADSLKSLCGTNKKALLHGVCVNDAGGGGTITLFNSRGANSGKFALIRSTAMITSGCNYFDVQLSSGITYTTSVAQDDVTFLFNCY